MTDKPTIRLNAESCRSIRACVIGLVASAVLAGHAAHAGDIRVDGVLEQVVQIEGMLSINQEYSLKAFDARNLLAATGDVHVSSSGAITQAIAARDMNVQQRNSPGAISIGNGIYAGAPGNGLGR